MTVSRHITMSSIALVVGVGQSAALTPLPPPCAYSGDMVEGREIVNTAKWPNSFVSYASMDKAERTFFYLEHCPSGKFLRARSQPYSVGSSGPRDADEIAGTVYEALDADRPYTMGQIQALLRDQGVPSKRLTSKVESCACQTYFPDAVGTKTPYKKDAK